MSREYTVNGKKYCFNSRNETFGYKSYGAIIVQDEDDIEKVKDIIRQMDIDEYMHYMPEGLIIPYAEQIRAQYTGKLDINLIDLTLICLDQGIWVTTINGTFNRWDDF